MKYSIEVDPDITARAQVIESDISPKYSVEISREIRGMQLQKAKDYLQDVIDMKRPLPIKKYKRKVSHRKGSGFGPGRYPEKAARVFLKLLNDCESNAEYSGLNTDALFIKHIVAHRGRVFRGWMPRAHGRATDWDNHTVNIELILEEREGEDGQ
jgi:large subunit ribosomal protein L22